uniref:Plus3 domain-containing protein n=1 Tax=Strongyloides papillosus TaxID=174720 RepID=A0A0N5BWL4_STREA
MVHFGLTRCYKGKKFVHVSLLSNSVFQYPKNDLESWIITVMKQTKIDENRVMKGELFISKEPDYIFDEFIPPEYRKIVSLN